MIRLAPVDPAPGSDAAWRAEYRRQQDAKRVATVQPDRLYVFLDPAGNERTEKIAFVEVRDVEPAAE
jgi:hypothetical protein